MIRTLIITGITTVLTLFGCSEQKNKDDGKLSKNTQEKLTYSSPQFKNQAIPREIDIKEFRENWGSTAVPDELEKLIEFQNHISSAEFYSQGFAVTIDDRSGLKSWSKDPSFLEKLFPFAQANGTGSFYVIWNDGTQKPMNKMPVVVFGDEGGTHIVAENILELLHLITFDAEISVDMKQAYFYKNEGYKKSRDLNRFLKWLQENYGLNATRKPSEIIASAQKKHKEQFDKWFAEYYKIK
ncbi:hypothetical protein ACM46_02390 [Chryseobacterium angstadtii]|uniref:Uncharacterized protein n=1 Tax=Chryseobacterium angstadtii TaxID=558151 RepID=A0A0J7IKE0_9FLAO|nr:hypothetical protein [Chryseobacterium angstadtii]KMQ66404.1 hypothetical protein ACM46_02390 [Chryseobacterium angstadtii]